MRVELTCLSAVSLCCFLAVRNASGKPAETVNTDFARHAITFPVSSLRQHSAPASEERFSVGRARDKRQSEDYEEQTNDSDGPEGRHLLKHRRKFKPHKNGILGCRKFHHGACAGGIFGGGGGFGYGFGGGYGGWRPPYNYYGGGFRPQGAFATASSGGGYPSGLFGGGGSAHSSIFNLGPFQGAFSLAQSG